LLIAVLVVVVIIGAGYLYIHGTGSHAGSVPDTSGAQQQAQDYWSTIQHDPHFYTALGAAITAAALMYGWKRIGNVGRYSLLVAIGIALALTFGGHR
jgi:hypothetical protein